MNKTQQKYTAFMESVCKQFSCPEMLPALNAGFKAFCEASDYSPSSLSDDELRVQIARTKPNDANLLQGLADLSNGALSVQEGNYGPYLQPNDSDIHFYLETDKDFEHPEWGIKSYTFAPRIPGIWTDSNLEYTAQGSEPDPQMVNAILDYAKQNASA
jgi:hypothetical protein